MATDVSVALLGYDSQHAASARPASEPDAADCYPAHALHIGLARLANAWHCTALHTELTRLKPWPYSRAAFKAMSLRPLTNWKPIAFITLVIFEPSRNFVIKSASFVTPGIFRIVASFR